MRESSTHLYKGANFSDSDNEHNEHINSYYLSFGSFCLMLSLCLFLNISDDKNSHFNEKYFFDNLSRCIDYYSKKYDRIVILGDFNSEPINEPVETFCSIICTISLTKKPALNDHQNVTT